MGFIFGGLIGVAVGAVFADQIKAFVKTALKKLMVK